MEYNENKAHYLAVTAIIKKDGKYLVVKRADWEKAFPGKWTVPGGKLEKSDYINLTKDTSIHWYNIFEKVVTREVLEEVNIHVNNIGYLTSMSFIRPDSVPTIIVSLYADYESGEIKLEDSLTEYKWITLEEAKEIDLIEGIYEEIKMLDDFLKTGKAIQWCKN